MQAGTGSSFLDHFAALRDPRQPWKIAYPLPEVLPTALSGTLAGAEDPVEVRPWAPPHMAPPCGLLPFAGGMPGRDTLDDIMNAVDAGLAPNLLRAAEDGHGLEVRRRSAAWDEAHPRAIIRQKA